MTLREGRVHYLCCALIDNYDEPMNTGEKNGKEHHFNASVSEGKGYVNLFINEHFSGR